MGTTMGKTGSNFLEALPSQGTLHIVMLGLDSAGKTTALYRLKFDQYLNTVPTIGFNCEKVQGSIGKAKGVQFLVWDVGGQEKLRPLWRSYTRCTDGILFVVDSVDVERMEEAKMELMRIAKCPDNQGVPVLILANKQDLPGARDPKELEKLLGLHELQYPFMHMTSLNMHSSSSASTGNIVGCSASSSDVSSLNTSHQHKINTCSRSKSTISCSLTPTTQHSRSFGGCEISISSSSSITKDLCLQHTTTKLFSSSSSSTLIWEQHHQHYHTDKAKMLGVEYASTQKTHQQKDFNYKSKTIPSSIAKTPTCTQPPVAIATSTLSTCTPVENTNATGDKTIPATMGNALQYKGWYIQQACAITGEGLQEGLEALYEMILKKRKLNKAFKKKR